MLWKSHTRRLYTQVGGTKKNCINTCPNCREDIKSYLDLVDFGDKDMVEFVDLDD